MEFNRLAEELGVGVDVFMELVDAWINSTEEDIQALESAGGDSGIKTVVDHAHKIKGASFQLGFNEIAEIARDIELRARSGSVEGLGESLERLKAMRDRIAGLRKNFKS